MTTIETRLGPITGIQQQSVTVFLGIPFAQPPVGENRWMPPRPVTAWKEHRDGTRFPNRCYQPPYPPVLAGREIPGDFSEDCLYLNIYTPSTEGSNRPVMFWIHGGAYIQGSANEYDGTALAVENDVVVVFINYRLGAFGFMDMSSFGAEYAGSASLGFQDQIAALGWVRDNIADYGGDPGNVTIFGESAGGGSVLALLAAPSASGLFHKAIAHSPGEPSGAPQDNTANLASSLGASGSELLSVAKALPADRILALQLEGKINPGAAIDGMVVTRQPSVAILENGLEGVPLITGCNRDEGSFMADLIPKEEQAIALQGFALGIGNGNAENYLNFLEQQIPGDNLRSKLVQVWYDLFRASSLRTAELHLLSNRSLMLRPDNLG